MRIAHIILAHNEPKQIERLIKRLQHKKADFYIHVDHKSRITDFKYLEDLGQVQLVMPRIKVYWGGFSMVQAMLNSIEFVLQRSRTYDYINFLSGQDYPLKDVYAIHDFFKQNQGKIFTEFLSVNDEWTEAKPRLTKYFLTDSPFAGHYFIERLANTFLPKRKIPKNMIPVGRSQWLTISSLHANHILEHLIDYPAILKYFKYTWGSDELFFQTLLYNSDYRSDMVNDNLRLIEWESGKSSPNTFTIKDADMLLNSNKLFARKFNSHVDSKILDLLDEQAAIAISKRPPEEDEDED